MFFNCTSLTGGVEIISTLNIGNYCCAGMFYNCESLVQAPLLPATGLTSDCYNEMFKNCTTLSSVSVNFSEWTHDTTTNWLYNVSEIGIFSCPSSLPDERDIDHIPDGWTKVDI